MAQSPGTPADGEVLKGFLCPVCYSDLKGFEQLHEHFEQAHSGEDQDVIQMFKDFFGKAKRKILKQDNEFEDNNSKPFEVPNSFQNSSVAAFDYFPADQEIGMTTSHMKHFEEIRNARIDRYVVETNRLLIRLDKLISEAPDDPEKRKIHEQNVVPWIPDGDVRLCPGCAKSFGLSRRRHHCRLCGGVMCQSCSYFIDFHFARKLIQPSDEDNQFALYNPPPLQRRGSNASLLSIVSSTGEPHVRICRDCHVLLIRRNQQIEDQNYRPAIVKKYERMRAYMEEVEKLAPLYGKMVDSLSAGETSYHLHDAQEVKMKLSKLAEGIDAVSKAISKLSSEDQEEDVSPKVMQLQSSIRMAATQFLKQTILGLPQLPTEDEVTRFRKHREEQIKRKVQLEKEAEMLAVNKNAISSKSHQNESRSPANQKSQEAKSPVSIESGWSASPGRMKEDHDNPMLQQMGIIRKYIKQARMDHKYDEVQMLEANLKELQLEYVKEQNSTT